MIKKKRAFPTIGGSFMAYMVEFRPKDGQWQWLPHKKHRHGIPYPRSCAGVIEMIGLFGYEQAIALAWAMKAHAKSQGDKLDFRLVPYDIEFDIKAYVDKKRIKAIK